MSNCGANLEGIIGKVTGAETPEGGKAFICKLEKVLGCTGVRLGSKRREEAVEMVPGIG